ncbi:MAG: hydrogenase maturation protease [Chloroflexi bacterium]|nr:hydrogenase maturation protease [Chloroflexota bacterium]
MARTLILGVGNPLMGDDAFGIRVVEALQGVELPSDVDVVDGGTQGLGLVLVMEPYHRVIIVDAVQMGLPAGTIRRFAWQDVQVNAGQVLSLHQSDLAAALTLAEALGVLPPEVVIFGVQPHNTEWDQPMSAAVEHALPVLVHSLIDEVRREDTYEPKSSDY